MRQWRGGGALLGVRRPRVGVSWPPMADGPSPLHVGPHGSFLVGYLCLWVHLEVSFMTCGPSNPCALIFHIEKKHKLDPRVDVSLGVLGMDHGQLGRLVGPMGGLVDPQCGSH